MPTDIIAVRDLEQRGGALVAQARALEVQDQAGLSRANALQLSSKRFCKDIDTIFEKTLEAEKAALEATRKTIAGLKQPALETQSILSPKITAYLVEERRKQREAEEKARKAKDEEERIAREAKAKALRAVQGGNLEKAQAILTRAEAKVDMIQAAVAPPPLAPKTVGLGIRTDWTFEIVDAAAVPPEYRINIPDEVKIGKVVRGLREQAVGMIPGVRVFSKDTLLTRTS